MTFLVKEYASPSFKQLFEFGSYIAVTFKRWGLLIIQIIVSISKNNITQKLSFKRHTDMFTRSIDFEESLYQWKIYFPIKYVIYKVLVYRLLVKLFKHQESVILKRNKNGTSHACAKKSFFWILYNSSYVLQDNGKMIAIKKKKS